MPERSKDRGLTKADAGSQARQPALDMRDRNSTKLPMSAREQRLAVSVRSSANLFFGCRPAATDFRYCSSMLESPGTLLCVTALQPVLIPAAML